MWYCGVASASAGAAAAQSLKRKKGRKKRSDRGQRRRSVCFGVAIEAASERGRREADTRLPRPAAAAEVREGRLVAFVGDAYPLTESRCERRSVDAVYTVFVS